MYNHSRFRITSGLIALSTAALLLGGCASKDNAPKFTADPMAFETAMSQAIELEIYSTQCAVFSAETEALAKQAVTEWNKRNWPQVDAADKQYSNQLCDQTFDYNNERIALSAIKFRAEVEKDALRHLDSTRQAHSNIHDICDHRLADFRDGKLDISSNTNLYLKSLASNAGEPHRVPTLAGTLELSAKPGRSQYDIEKNLNEWNCQNAEILTLRNDWPHEGYGIFCDSKQTIFVTCEWGECSKHGPEQPAN